MPDDDTTRRYIDTAQGGPIVDAFNRKYSDRIRQWAEEHPGVKRGIGKALDKVRQNRPKEPKNMTSEELGQASDAHEAYKKIPGLGRLLPDNISKAGSDMGRYGDSGVTLLDEPEGKQLHVDESGRAQLVGESYDKTKPSMVWHPEHGAIPVAGGGMMASKEVQAPVARTISNEDLLRHLEAMKARMKEQEESLGKSEVATATTKRRTREEEEKDIAGY